MRIVIGLVGAKGAGKDTAADFLVKSGKAVRYALADKIKRASSDAFNIHWSYFEDRDNKEKDLPVPVVLTDNKIIRIFRHYVGDNNIDHRFVVKHVGTLLRTPRQVAQYVGTEMIRDILGADAHVEAMLDDMPSDGVFVVTDVRFPNEFKYLSDNSLFLPVYVSNAQAERVAEKDTHESERHVRDLAKRCTKLDNNGTLGGLEDRALRLFAELTAPYLK